MGDEKATKVRWSAKGALESEPVPTLRSLCRRPARFLLIPALVSDGASKRHPSEASPVSQDKIVGSSLYLRPV
jgi:hypothetical protein